MLRRHVEAVRQGRRRDKASIDGERGCENLCVSVCKCFRVGPYHFRAALCNALVNVALFNLAAATMRKDLFDILRAYSCLVPPKLISFPEKVDFTVLHDFLLDSLLLASNLPHLQAYPPSDQYQFSFWKWAIKNLEELAAAEEDVEIDGRIYEHLMSLFAAPSM